MRKPLLVGVTGGIGSGKSLVCRIFSSMGVPVYYADDRAKWISRHDPAVQQEITALLGSRAYDAGGEYDRAYVASRVFADAGLLEGLNRIIHPRVAADTRSWLEANSGHPYLLKEAAIMHRAGQGNDLDYVVAVTAPEDIRTERVLQRDAHRRRDEVEAIIRSQVTDAERAAMADFVIRNDGSTPLLPQVTALHEKLLHLSRR